MTTIGTRDDSMSHTQLVHRAVAQGLTKWPDGHWSRPKHERDEEARRISIELHARISRGEVPQAFVTGNSRILAETAPEPPRTQRGWMADGLYRALKWMHSKRSSLPAIERRHLIYHVCPLQKNDVWRLNVRRLSACAEIFNGRRVVAIARGPGLHDVDEVRRELGFSCEVLEVDNCRVLREVASFPRLLESVYTTDPSSAIFYAHTKGNSSTGDAQAVARWRNMMYSKLLNEWSCAVEALRTWSAVGTTKLVWRKNDRSPYPTGLKVGTWMFAGTFFWFRADQTFTRAWRHVAHDRYGAESWLSSFMSPYETQSLFQPWPEGVFPKVNVYSSNLYGQEFDDAPST